MDKTMSGVGIFSLPPPVGGFWSKDHGWLRRGSSFAPWTSRSAMEAAW